MAASLDRVLVKELEALKTRRARLGLDVVSTGPKTPASGASLRLGNHPVEPQAPADVRDIDTVGVCFSSGGLRSAAFSAGVLRSFSTSGYLPKVDYISCVSGGACAAASFVSHVACQTGRPGIPPADEERGGAHDVAHELASGAERALHQLRRHCSSPMARGHAGEMFLYCLQVSCALANALVVCPLMVVAGSVIFSGTVDAVIGNSLRNLLENGLVDVHWAENGWLIFLGPILAATCCLSFAHLQRRHTPTEAEPLKPGTISSPAGQIALVLSSILFAVWGVVILMFLDERLFRGTIADEVVQGIILLLWAYTVVILVVGSPSVNQRRDALVSCLKSLMGWSVLWIAARIHVLRVTGRMDGVRVNESAVASFLILALVHDYLSRGVHPLFRQRLRAAFFCNVDAEEETCASLCRTLLDTPHPSCSAGERWCGNAAWHGKNSPASSSLIDDARDSYRQRPSESITSGASAACGRNLGDLYYGHKQQGVSAERQQFVSERPQFGAPMSRHYRVPLQEESAMPRKKCDPPLAELDLSSLPYLLVNTVASGYVKKRFVQNWRGKERDVCQFLLSPLFCGSERTGYLQTPPTLSLSGALAMSCNNDPFSAASSDMGDSLQDRFPRLGLSTGDWLPLTPPRTSPPPTSPNPPVDSNPTPNFFLDPSGSRPLPRPPLRPPPIPPWLARILAPTLALSTILSLVDPAFLLIPLGMGLAALLLSFLPEGRSLLFSPQLRGMHRLLGAVHSSERPPPLIHLSDGGGGDALGLLELLRRRCATVFVCDAALDEQLECQDLVHVLEQARRELGCAFLPTPGCSGDVSTALRDFQQDAHARTLHIKVHYFARPKGLGTPALWGAGQGGRETLVKIGDVFVLKCRATPRDKDLNLKGVHTPPPDACSLVGECAPPPCTPPEGLRGVIRRGLRLWRTSCVDANANTPVVQEPALRFCSQQAFTRYSALGARAAWAALEMRTESQRGEGGGGTFGGASVCTDDSQSNSPGAIPTPPSSLGLSPLAVSHTTLLAHSKAEYVHVPPSESVLSFNNSLLK